VRLLRAAPTLSARKEERMSLLESALPIPVTILTGYLGAGKTTLLNRILRGDHGLRVAVMVNDFGPINIDTELIIGVAGESVSLANGCICCTIRDDLLRATLHLMARPDPPEYILIEASGVSDPVAIAATFLLPELRRLIAVDGIITVVDTEQAYEQRHGSNGMVEEQICAADIVVMNKIDLVNDARRRQVRAWIEALVPRVRVIEASYGSAPLELLLGVGRYRLQLEPAAPHGAHEYEHDHDHGAAFSSWNYSTDEPLDLRATRTALKQLPPTIVRAKGVLYTADAPERRVIFHLVCRRIALTAGERWGDTPPRTHLVAIGAPGGIDAAALTARFDACRAAERPRNPLVAAWEWVRSE
jgi:G3E family GTPase